VASGNRSNSTLSCGRGQAVRLLVGKRRAPRLCWIVTRSRRKKKSAGVILAPGNNLMPISVGIHRRRFVNRPWNEAWSKRSTNNEAWRCAINETPSIRLRSRVQIECEVEWGQIESGVAWYKSSLVPHERCYVDNGSDIPPANAIRVHRWK